MLDKDYVQDIEKRMSNAVEVLKKNFSGLQTGKASVGLLSPVIVEIYGEKMPISQVANISTPDAKTISVQVWDKSNIKNVEKAIVDSGIGLTPNTHDSLIRLNMPTPSEERRKELIRLAHKYGENGKIAIRNVRRDILDVLKQQEKNHEISEDELHIMSGEVQKITDKFIGEIDKNIGDKEKEIMSF